MAILKCKMCGGDLHIEEGMTVCECEYCGSEQTLPRLTDDRKINLYDRANHFRRNNDFDKAMGIYEQILIDDNTDSETYWSIVLCRYGIEYVEDPSTHKRIPTVNRAQYTSIFDDEDYKEAIKNADSLQKKIYENEATTINEIQKGILEISQKEEPFDVFICYKETDNNGRRTQDSVLANDLYHQLTQEGFKTFFSRITLEDKLGSAYEPYIFAALNSAKVMVVLGTKQEYFNAVWVKNEWSRFLSISKNSNGAKKLIPAYKDMDPYDLPEEFSHLQAQDMSKLGFMQDLIRGIKKIIGTEQEQQKTQVKETVVVQQGNTGNLSALIKRGNMALEDEEWEKADGFFEEVLNQNAESAEAYLGKFLSKMQRSNSKSLIDYYVEKYADAVPEKLLACDEATDYIDEKAKNYAIDILLKESYLRQFYEYDRTYLSNLSCRVAQKDAVLAEIESDKLFMRAKKYASGDILEQVNTIIEDMIKIFDDRINTEREKDEATIEKIKEDYANHISSADVKAKESYDSAVKRREYVYNTAVECFENAVGVSEYKTAMERFKNVSGYKDSDVYLQKCYDALERIKEEKRAEEERKANEKIEEEKRSSRRSTIVGISVIVLAILGFVLSKLITNVILPAREISRQEKIFSSETVILSKANIGEKVSFGLDGQQWLVIDKQGDSLLLLSVEGVEKRAFQYAMARVYWKDSDLRYWLNDTYLFEAFSEAERNCIKDSDINNVDIYDGKVANTRDRLFLLSVDEVEHYLVNEKDRVCVSIDGETVSWWLRNPGHTSDYVKVVQIDGLVDHYGVYTNSDTLPMVRPAMWIDIPQID